MRILVTGGAGFIGSALVRRLVAEGEHSVVNVDKLTYAATPGALAEVEGAPSYAFEQIDICDPLALREVFSTHRPEAVFALAAETHVDRSIDGPASFVQTNVVGTSTLLEATTDHWSALGHEARERFRFLQVSTDEVFGSLGTDGRFLDESPYRPNSPYAASKAAGDHFVRAWHRTYGLPTLIANASNTFGPFQFPEKLIPLVVAHALEGVEIPVYGSGRQVREWLYVDDHVEALLALWRGGHVGHSYNVGGRSERTNLDLVRSICRLVDALVPRPSGGSSEDLIRFVKDRPGHDFRYALGGEGMSGHLGWRPRHRFDEALARTVRWYVERPDWSRELRRHYVGERPGLGLTKPR